MSTREERLRRRIGRVLWSMASVEHAATATVQVIVAGDEAGGYLTTRERAFLEETIRPQETAHSGRFAAWGLKLYGPKPAGHLPYDAMTHKELLLHRTDPPMRFAYCLASLYWNEKYNLAGAKLVSGILATVDRELGQDYADVMGDEVGHVAWGRGVIKRLEQQQPMVARLVHRYLDYLRVIYPTLIDRSHVRVYRELMPPADPTPGDHEAIRGAL